MIDPWTMQQAERKRNILELRDWFDNYTCCRCFEHMCRPAQAGLGAVIREWRELKGKQNDDRDRGRS